LAKIQNDLTAEAQDLKMSVWQSQWHAVLHAGQAPPGWRPEPGNEADHFFKMSGID
jgi:hypothetical protein